MLRFIALMTCVDFGVYFVVGHFALSCWHTELVVLFCMLLICSFRFSWLFGCEVGVSCLLCLMIDCLYVGCFGCFWGLVLCGFYVLVDCNYGLGIYYL